MKTKINKFNLSLMIISWVVTIWGIIAEKLAYKSSLNNTTKFWLSMTVPVSSSIISFMQSIKFGMEIKEVQVSKKLSLSHDFGNELVISNNNNNNNVITSSVIEKFGGR